MPSCRVSDCSNRSGGGVRLFSIPKRSRDVDIAKKWLKSVWNKELDEDQFTILMKEEFRVCAEHFIESDFDSRGKLKADAVPSRFPWNGGQQRTYSQRMKAPPPEHKSNGLLTKLTRTLKAAESVVDGEIKDTDKWIIQLQSQVDQLRSKREKLVQHKADLGRSINESILLSTSRGQLSSSNVKVNDCVGNPGNTFLLNGTNLFPNADIGTHPGESPILSTVAGSTASHSNACGRRMKPKPVRRTADEMMADEEVYSSPYGGDASQLLLVTPTPPENAEAISNFDQSSPSITTPISRQFSTRRKSFKPIRVPVASRTELAELEAASGDDDLHVSHIAKDEPTSQTALTNSMVSPSPSNANTYDAYHMEADFEQLSVPAANVETSSGVVGQFD